MSKERLVRGRWLWMLTPGAEEDGEDDAPPDS